MPKYFRDAGHFWGIAAGTPPSVIRRRIAEIDHTVEKSRATLDQSGRDEVASRHGLTLFSRADLDRVAEFQATLKLRFLTGKDLVEPQGHPTWVNRVDAAVRGSGEQFERAATVGLVAATTAVELGHGCDRLSELIPIRDREPTCQNTIRPATMPPSSSSSAS